MCLCISTLEFVVYETTETFNIGNIIKCLMLEKFGLDPGVNCVQTMKKRMSVGSGKRISHSRI